MCVSESPELKVPYIKIFLGKFAQLDPEVIMFRPALSGGMDWWRMELPFSRVRKIFFRGRNFQEIPEIPQKERFSPNFRLRNLKSQSPKKCNSIPPAIPYPTRLPPNVRPDYIMIGRWVVPKTPEQSGES